MKKIIVYFCIGMLVMITFIPMNTSAGDVDNPEVEDRILDVKFLGLINLPGQFLFKYADIVSAWVNEDAAHPEYLYISMKLRDLLDKTDNLEAIYDVGWYINNNRYISCVHANPNGYGPFVFGKSEDGDDEYEFWDFCEGSFDLENNIITWEVPKTVVGNPQIGSKITIHPHTHLRFRDDSNLPHWDLFKDLYHNAKYIKDYTIQY